MSQIHLNLTGFMLSVCRPFTKIKERRKKIKKEEILNTSIKLN